VIIEVIGNNIVLKSPLPPSSNGASTPNKLTKKELYSFLSGPEDEILSTIGQNSINIKSLNTLRPKAWLNDEVMTHNYNSFFFNKLFQNNSYNYTNVMNFSRHIIGQNIISLEKLLIPVHENNNHWTLILVNFKHKNIQYLDCDNGTKYIQATFRFLQDENQNHHDHNLPQLHEWTLTKCRGETPKQSNNYDCGVFVCVFAESIMRNAFPSFTQNDINDSTRQWIMEAILQKRIPNTDWRYCNTFS